MSLSDDIRKVADSKNGGFLNCALPESMGNDCSEYERCQECMRDAFKKLADKVELLERERTEDSEIAEWVRERGGIEIVKEQCKFSDDAATWIRKLAEYEDDEAVDIDAAMYGIERRLMPRGMEWPRFEDNGELVTDENCPDDAVGVFFALDSSCWAPMYDVPDNAVEMHERVKRPKPDPICADGLPIKKGETVFDLCKDEYIVDSFDKRFGLTMVNVHKPGCDISESIWVSCLTHTNPDHADSWERLEEDAEKLRQTIAQELGDYEFDDSGDDSVQTRLIDLVKRAKALAEKENEK